MIQAALYSGQLPCGTECAGCGKNGESIAVVILECERIWFKDISAPGWVKVILTVPAFFFGGLLALWHRDEVAHGQHRIYHLPLSICAGCLPLLSAKKTIFACLRAVPDYARLLDKYPAARVLQVKKLAPD
ncbi:MAG: hypothetical protein AB7K24_30185 [Gemmataceae bacterium]